MANNSEAFQFQKAREQFGEMVSMAELYLHRGFLEQLGDAPVAPMDQTLRRMEPGSNLRLVELDAVLCEKAADLPRKIRDLFGAVETYDAGIMLIVNGKRDRVRLCLGVCADAFETVNPAFNTMIRSLSGILPGCKYRQMKTDQARELLWDVFPVMANAARPERHAMACVSALPVVDRDRPGDPYEAIDRLDVLIDGMRGRPFTMVLLNKAVSCRELMEMERQLQLLYSQLSPFERVQLSSSESQSDSVSLNWSLSVNSNESYSTGLTHGVTQTQGTSKTVVRNEPDDHSARSQAGMGLLGSAVALGVGLVGGSVGTDLIQTMFYSSAMTNLFSNTGIYTGLAPRARDGSISDTTHVDRSVSDSKQVTFSTSGGTSDSSGYTIGNSMTAGSSSQYTMTNKYVSDLLTELDQELTKLQALEREGAFAGAAYFIAGDRETAVTAANIYRAMTQTDGGAAIHCPINCWSSPEALSGLTDYLCRGRHPVFTLPGAYAPTAEAAQLIGLGDTPVYLSLPERSVPGFIVSEYASFSRDVIAQSGRKAPSAQKNGAVGIGHIYHMGRVETQTPVELSVDDLTKHLFVTGATGVGKSNFCYQLLDQLLARGVRTLIVEPAKGEYAGVFGGRTDGEGKPLFHVYGADPMRSPVLRINPFAFPDGVSVIQHTERLMDIFNAAWPMYSAMPAILKEGIEQIYTDRGFDLILGRRPEGTQFPCFEDLLQVLPRIIGESAYSREVQGNYIGALVTRVKSLTNGIYGIIFGRDETGDSVLFDENVIVDISRVGSAETKALVMGVLTMRLNEYRMCSALVNSPLRHVTLLEEAHNLLRGQTQSSAEGANVRAASVEMITNAIAEMRTYGEGFIIADQSPSVLDQSVIRNTQTKVCFMLPDRHDRETMGNALSLSEAQKQEVARLSPGVAAVYQNGWTSAVLCKINYFPPEMAKPFRYDGAVTGGDMRELTGQCLAVILSSRLRGGASGVDREAIRRLLKEDFSLYGQRAGEAKAVLRRYLDAGAEPEKDEQMALIARLIPLERIIRSAGMAEGQAGVKRWAALVREKLNACVSLTEAEIYVLISAGIHTFYPAPPEKRQAFRTLYLTYCSPDGTGVEAP